MFKIREVCHSLQTLVGKDWHITNELIVNGSILHRFQLFLWFRIIINQYVERICAINPVQMDSNKKNVEENKNNQNHNSQYIKENLC